MQQRVILPHDVSTVPANVLRRQVARRQGRPTNLRVLRSRRATARPALLPCFHLHHCVRHLLNNCKCHPQRALVRHCSRHLVFPSHPVLFLSPFLLTSSPPRRPRLHSYHPVTMRIAPPTPHAFMPTPRQPTLQLGPSLARTTVTPTSCFNIWRRLNRPAESSARHSADPWVFAFVLVTFDLDKGPVVEACIPNAALSDHELDAVCAHAMPDSAAVGSGSEDAVYSFRVSRAYQHHDESSKNDHLNHHNHEQILLLAHSFFRQTPDRLNRRGFFQKALVLVTSAPYISVPAVLLSSLAPKTFVHGAEALRQAIDDIASWPDPRVQTMSRHLTLPFVGDTLHLELPASFLDTFSAPIATLENHFQPAHNAQLSPISITNRLNPYHDYHQLSQQWDVSALKHPGVDSPARSRMWPLCAPSSKPSAALFNEINLAVALNGVLDHLTTLWELVAIGEPILVVAPTPSQAAAAVMALIGLIHPLPFVGDWRPYLCIQDPTYARVCAAEDVSKLLPDGAIFGVTNIHMASTLKFPHVLYLASIEKSPKGKQQRACLQTTHRPSLQRSRQVQHAIRQALNSWTKGPSQMNKTAQDLRSNVFERMTRPFLRAFDQYLVPTWGEEQFVTEEPYASDPFEKPLRLRPFDVDMFPTLSELSSNGLNGLFRGGVGSKNRIRDLYKRFIDGPVFKIWWAEARSTAERECTALHRTDMMEACVRKTGVVTRLLNPVVTDDAILMERIVELARRVYIERQNADPDDKRLCDLLEELYQSLTLPLPEDQYKDSLPSETC